MEMATETYNVIHTDESVYGPFCPEHGAEAFESLAHAPGADLVSHGGFGRGELEPPEVDYPASCSNMSCGALLDVRLTDEGLQYVKNEVAYALTSRNTVTFETDSPFALWAEEYGDQVAASVGIDVDAILDRDEVIAAYFEELEVIKASTIDAGTQFSQTYKDRGVEDVDAFIEKIELYIGFFDDTFTLNPQIIGADFARNRNELKTGFHTRGLGAFGDWLARVAGSFSPSF